MTDFSPLKQKIWKDARESNWEQFDKDCEALMEKAITDIWRMGWSIAPKDINEVYELLDKAALWCHERWIEAMKSGDAPAEDVSPGEGFALMKQVIKDAMEGNSKK